MGEIVPLNSEIDRCPDTPFVARLDLVAQQMLVGQVRMYPFREPFRVVVQPAVMTPSEHRNRIHRRLVKCVRELVGIEFRTYSLYMSA